MSCDVLICIDGRRLYLVSASWELPNGGALGLVKVSRLQISFLLASFKLPLRLNRAGSIKAVLIHVSDPFFFTALNLSPSTPLSRIQGPDLLYCTEIIPARARLHLPASELPTHRSLPDQTGSHEQTEFATTRILCK